MKKLTSDGWRFAAAENDEFVPILHDCTATKIEIEGRELRLFFPDGFRLLPNDPHNPYDTPLPTKAGLLVFTLYFEPDDLIKPEDMIRIEVYHDHWLRPYRLFRRNLPLFTVRKEPTLAELTEKMNSGKWTLFAIGYQCGFAYTIAFIVWQLGRIFAGGVNVIGAVLAGLALAALLWQLFKPYKESQKLTVK